MITGNRVGLNLAALKGELPGVPEGRWSPAARRFIVRERIARYLLNKVKVAGQARFQNIGILAEDVVSWRTSGMQFGALHRAVTD